MVNYIFNTEDEVANSTAYEFMLTFAKEQLLKRQTLEVAQNANVTFDETKSAFMLESLGQKIIVELPSCNATLVEHENSPHWAWHLIILHYLSEADGTPPGTELMTFRTQEGGFIRGAGFDRENAEIIANNFACKPLDNVKKACESLGAVFLETSADICAVFRFLPNYPITMQIWAGDDEMAGSGKLLISSQAAHYLSVEDAVTAGTIVLKFLKQQYKTMFPEI